MDTLTFDLNISDTAKTIGSQILESSDKEFIKMGLTRIEANFSNYDDFVFAGRLLINEIVRSVNSMDVYLTLNKSAFSTEVYDYFVEHKDLFDTMMCAYERDNYTNQDYFSAEMLCRQYLLRSTINKGPTETPILSNLRLAVQFYHDVSIDKVLKAFHEMCKSYYTHASPTKFNAGTKNPQMASCFLMNVKDDLGSMMYTGIGDMAMISSHAGGIGIGLNDIRHSDIAGTGDSAGILPYARVCDRAIGYVDQSRKRRGAATGFVNIWHLDAPEFIGAASNFISHDLRLVDLHTCMWTHDLFFERASRDQKWTLFCPNTVKDLKGKYGAEFERIYLQYEHQAPITEETYLQADADYDAIRNEISRTVSPNDEMKIRFTEAAEHLRISKKNRIVYKTVNARDLLEKIGDTQLKSGKPYVMNGDRCNAKSNQQNIGPISNSNLCVEIVQYSSPEQFASCNLASINLPRFGIGRFDHSVVESVDSDAKIMSKLVKVYDFVALGSIVRSVVNNLDKVIDHNMYLFDENKIKNLNFNTRPLGIGVSGLDDAFKVLDIVYGSRESIILNKMIFACMYFNALTESNNIAKTTGPYHHFNTGTCSIFDPSTGRMETLEGSPLSNGLFQFDLWDREYHYDKSLDRIHKSYDPADNIPIDPIYFGSEVSWDDLRSKIVSNGVRHSLLIALMPTASTAQVLRNAESTEAHQANIYTRQLGNGSYNIVNRHLYADLDEINIHNADTVKYIYNNVGKLDGLATHVRSVEPDMSETKYKRIQYLEKKYKTMFDIKPTQYLAMARQRGIYVCQSQSTNVYMVDPTPTQLMGVQHYAYTQGLKTHSYYVRMISAMADTGFNKTVEDSKLFDAGHDGVKASETAVVDAGELMCRIDNPDCTSCQ